LPRAGESGIISLCDGIGLLARPSGSTSN